MALPYTVTSGRVVGRFLVGVVDGSDANDEPDVIPATGKVTFMASIPYTPSPEVMTFLAPITAILDDEGYLCTPDPENPDVAGTRGVRLTSTDNLFASNKDWTWRVTARLFTPNGMPWVGNLPASNFLLPAGGEIDLASVVRVPHSTGVSKEQAVVLTEEAQDAAKQAAVHAEVAYLARDIAEGVAKQADDGKFTPKLSVGVTKTVSKDARVWDTGTPLKPVLNFEIPQGIQGIQGPQGPQGDLPDTYISSLIDPAPAEDIPKITSAPMDIWMDGPSIEGSAGWFREKRVDADEKAPNVGGQYDNGDLDLEGSSYFRYPTLPAAENYGPNPGRIIISKMKPGGDFQYANWLFNIEFETSSPVVEFALNPSIADGRFGRVLVNGKPVSNRALTYKGNSGTGLSVKLTFPSAKKRVITVYGLNNTAGRFGGVGVAEGYTVTKTVARPTRRIAFIGDSYVNGTDTVAATETFVWRLASLMAADEVLHAGIGGTGFNATIGDDAKSTLDGRIDAVLAMDPDVVVFAAGRNDAAAADLQSKVTSTLARVQGREIYLVSTASSLDQVEVTAALKAGASDAGVPFINVDVDGLDKEDAVHPTFEAHQEFADAIYAQMVSKKHVGPQGIQGLKGNTGAKGDKGDRGLVGLTPNMKIGVVNTTANPADQQWIADIIRKSAPVTAALSETFPSTMKGDRGDAGIGWAASQLGTTDLNTVTTPGIYGQSSATTISNQGSTLNYPPTLPTGARGRFVMTVMNWGGNSAVLQIINTIGTSTLPGLTFTRYLEPNNPPSAWSTDAAQRVDTTAGRAIYTWDDRANREQLSYGDTGKRIINDMINPELGVAVAKMRRTGSTVELHIQLNKPSGLTGAKVNILNEGLPQGFRNQHTIVNMMGGGTGKQYTIDYNGMSMHMGDITAPAAAIFIHVMFTTTDPWPTSLPGTADGNVPNL